MKTSGILNAVVFFVAVAVVAAPAFAVSGQRIVRRADGSPICIRVERTAGASRLLAKSFGDEVDALRSLADPSGISDEDSQQPLRYCGSKWSKTSLDEKDRGGVHGNCGVQNHFFYLLCEGGKGWDDDKELSNDGIEYEDFVGIGVENAAQIAYQVLTAYCGPRTDYRQVREYWLDAAIDMIEADSPDFDDAEDLDITKHKYPFVDDDDKTVPNKYNIIVKLPKDSPSGF